MCVVDMEMRCPGGVKVLQYRKAKLEKFAPYLLKDGLLTRLTTCHDLDCESHTQASDCLSQLLVFSDNWSCCTTGLK